MTKGALGIRVKSGRAIAVVATGSRTSLEVRAVSTLMLMDPDDPATKQPYHAGFGELEENAAVLRARTARVRRAARAAVRALLRDCHTRDVRIVGAGIVVGSVIDPERIANPHIRAHAFEGRLFRTAVQEPLAAAGVATHVVVEREAIAAAAALIGRSHEDLKRTLAGFGRGIAGPWRADEKLAALAGWMVLAGLGQRQRSGVARQPQTA